MMVVTLFAGAVSAFVSNTGTPTSCTSCVSENFTASSHAARRIARSASLSGATVGAAFRNADMNAQRAFAAVAKLIPAGSGKSADTGCNSPIEIDASSASWLAHQRVPSVLAVIPRLFLYVRMLIAATPPSVFRLRFAVDP